MLKLYSNETNTKKKEDKSNQLHCEYEKDTLQREKISRRYKMLDK